MPGVGPGSVYRSLRGAEAAESALPQASDPNEAEPQAEVYPASRSSALQADFPNEPDGSLRKSSPVRRIVVLRHNIF